MQYANWSSTAHCIPSSDMPSGESVLTAPWEEFREVCHLTYTRWEPRSLAFIRCPACFSFCACTYRVPFFNWVTFLALPVIESRAFCTVYIRGLCCTYSYQYLMLHTFMSVSLSLNIINPEASIMTVTVFLSMLWILTNLYCGSVTVQHKSAFMNRISRTIDISMLLGEKEK
jgi:hypothetical protein